MGRMSSDSKQIDTRLQAATKRFHQCFELGQREETVAALMEAMISASERKQYHENLFAV
jgi:hypothetical protein